MYRVTAPRYTTSRTCPVAVQSSASDGRVRLDHRDLLRSDRERRRSIPTIAPRRPRHPGCWRRRRTRRRTRSRALVHLGGRADLLDPAVVEHGEAVAHRERLLLVVRHVDEGRAPPPAGSPSARSASPGGASGRGRRAARRAGAPSAASRAPARARPAGAARPTAASACGRRTPRGAPSRARRAAVARRSAFAASYGP